MEKTGFILYKGMYEPIKDLSDEKFGKLMKAIFEYQKNLSIPKLDNDIQMAFLFFKNQFDVDNNKYDEICKKRQEVGKLGGRPKKSKGNQKNQKVILETKKTYIDKDKEIDIEIEKENNKEIISTEITKTSFGNEDINIIIESLKNCNMGILDDTIKKQRQYGKLIKGKLDDIKGFNGNYGEFITKIYDLSNEYQKQYFKSAEKFYYNIAGIVAGIKTQIETKKPQIGRC